MFKEIDDRKFKVPTSCYTIENTGRSQSFQSINVKAVMSCKSAREYAHPNERDLIIVDLHRNSKRCFAIVDNYKHTYLPGDSCEVFLWLKIYSPIVFRQGEEVELKVVMSLTNEIRQWTGLINFHTSCLIRDLLYPRGKEYFCQFSLSKPSLTVSTVCILIVLRMYVHIVLKSLIGTYCRHTRLSSHIFNRK